MHLLSYIVCNWCVSIPSLLYRLGFTCPPRLWSSLPPRRYWIVWGQRKPGPAQCHVPCTHCGEGGLGWMKSALASCVQCICVALNTTVSVHSHWACNVTWLETDLKDQIQNLWKRLCTRILYYSHECGRMSFCFLFALCFHFCFSFLAFCGLLEYFFNPIWLFSIFVYVLVLRFLVHALDIIFT